MYCPQNDCEYGPGGPYWNYYSGVPIFRSSPHNSFKDWTPIDLHELHIPDYITGGRNNSPSNSHQGPHLLTWLTLIPAWISNYIHYKVWGEITYPNHTRWTSMAKRKSCRGLAFGHRCSACMIWCVGACVFYLLCLHALFILQSGNSSSS